MAFRASTLLSLALLASTSLQTAAFLAPSLSAIHLRVPHAAHRALEARSPRLRAPVVCSASPVGRREALGAFGAAAGLLVAGEPLAVGAYCPPNCTGLPSPAEKPAEVKKEEKVRDDGPVVDLSTPEGQALAKV
ncbi:hypothetical protein T484DRAFT_1829800 [Baffinella frigidus]|nr:hypothetical protein T484DRAFT_1829800 [Cryptophyta sp. CCMP2293]